MTLANISLMHKKIAAMLQLENGSGTFRRGTYCRDFDR